jgi:chromosome segregation ATPase
MPDNAETPEQQSQDPGQQEHATTATAPVDWEGRYKGSVKKIEELTLANRGLQEQLTAKTSEVEQLRVQLGQKDTEHQVAVTERDKQLSTFTEERASMQAELKELRAYKTKVEMAIEAEHPELVKIIHRIPNVEDPEVMKSIIGDFASFTDEAVKARERQLLAGTNTATRPVNQPPAAPTTRDAWLKKINETPIGTPERAKLLDDYGDWLEAQN